MTYDPQGGTGVFHCDTCPEEIECDSCPDFETSKAFAYGKGWRTYRGPDNQWANSCPVCVAEFAKSKRR